MLSTPERVPDRSTEGSLHVKVSSKHCESIEEDAYFSRYSNAKTSFGEFFQSDNVGHIVRGSQRSLSTAKIPSLVPKAKRSSEESGAVVDDHTLTSCWPPAARRIVGRSRSCQNMQSHVRWKSLPGSVSEGIPDIGIMAIPE